MALHPAEVSVTSYGWRIQTTVGTVAACGFSGVRYTVITSPQVLDIVKGVIGKAFKIAF